MADKFSLKHCISLDCLYLEGLWCLNSIFFDYAFTYWDDWLRLKENHKGRQFIRPEVCRTYNFGEHVSI